ncbi:deoxyribodipyrimidine photo-lyase [Microbulbifer sp. 2205BS26-8]|uniref:cryptochrome/photolyase family protein n=1 Tax=Microbulbifer sp. 2205BS26-8 TaxID=3064386 RepID=UPI00273EB58C|nr:FAD-binding domain-containing protein [Microbulbifer sp. 2205BS26-8]MDP5210622.1 FAD-binding domain-containing protein [Microbulbifer sp. 2205BS26-8]
MRRPLSLARGLVWFRSDLRMQDNSALYHASQCCEYLAALFIACPHNWKSHGEGDALVAFRMACLHELQTRLQTRNIPLYYLNISTFSQVPKALQKVALRLKIEGVFANAEYPINEQRRDHAVRDILCKSGIHIEYYSDRTLLPPGSVRTGNGEPYKVFTPFKRTLLQLCAESAVNPLPVPRKMPIPDGGSHWPKWLEMGRGVRLTQKIPSQLPHYSIDNTVTGMVKGWKAGEKEAQKRLKLFGERITRYQAERDFPALDSTSRLSPYLNSGAISIRQCAYMALSLNDGNWQGGSEGIACWISELIWREFYTHLLVDFPRLSKGQPFKLETERIPWVYNQKLFDCWGRGETGVPIVDAAMHQLNESAWMHNRLRMIVASFLSKNMLIDWRWGERYFMQHLIDGDFASNNGGWQWTASTGTDAAPYFRVFNPYSQSQKFDPDGTFIRRYIPELASLNNREIHNPPPVSGYPQVICDVGAGRKRAIAVFARIK